MDYQKKLDLVFVIGIIMSFLGIVNQFIYSGIINNFVYYVTSQFMGVELTFFGFGIMVFMVILGISSKKKKQEKIN